MAAGFILNTVILNETAPLADVYTYGSYATPVTTDLALDDTLKATGVYSVASVLKDLDSSVVTGKVKIIMKDSSGDILGYGFAYLIDGQIVNVHDDPAIAFKGYTDGLMTTEQYTTLNTKIDNLVNGATGPGSTAVVVTVEDTSNDPLENVDVWVTTDEAGTDVIAGTIKTNSSGQVTFMLDAGTYYIWRQLGGYNFTNPQEYEVT